MSAAPPLPLAEVTRRAIAMLTRELGPADAARFVTQFSGGSGDYTTDRAALFDGRTVAQLAADIRAAVGPGPGDGAEPRASADRGLSSDS